MRESGEDVVDDNACVAELPQKLSLTKKCIFCPLLLLGLKPYLKFFRGNSWRSGLEMCSRCPHYTFDIQQGNQGKYDL